MKGRQIWVLILLVGLLLQNCSDLHSDEVLRNQVGKLYWGGFPGLDGLGVMFATADTTYGLQGNREDYSRYFPSNKDEVQIRADLRLTGETTRRGWGARFPEAVLLRVRIQ